MQQAGFPRRVRHTQQVVEQRKILRRDYSHGVLDWGPVSRPARRYEAYWRGLSLGYFGTERAAWVYLRTFADVLPGDAC
jgi:hypothetical protein